MITIAIADDHPVMRQGLRSLLVQTPDFEVIGEAADGLDALRVVEGKRPDVLLVDVMMPALNGLEVARQVSQRFPATKVAVLSMHAAESYVVEALRNGAIGYILKESSTEDVLEGVREVAAGRRYLSPPLTARAIDAYVERARASEEGEYDLLTTREREVLQLTAEGLGRTEIAERLFISPRTVESHRASMMRKLGLKRRADVIRFAVQRGMISATDALPDSKERDHG